MKGYNRKEQERKKERKPKFMHGRNTALIRNQKNLLNLSHGLKTIREMKRIKIAERIIKTRDQINGDTS